MENKNQKATKNSNLEEGVTETKKTKKEMIAELKQSNPFAFKSIGNRKVAEVKELYNEYFSLVAAEERERKAKRAAGYAVALVAFQEVGAGPDEHLAIVQNVASKIRFLCKAETGIELESYPTQYVKDHIEDCKKSMYFLKNFKEGGAE